MAARRREEVAAEARALELLEQREALGRELAMLERLQVELALPELRRLLGEEVPVGPLPRLPYVGVLDAVGAVDAMNARIERLRRELAALDLFLGALSREERELLEREPQTVLERRARLVILRQLVVLIGGVSVADEAEDARGRGAAARRRS